MTDTPEVCPFCEGKSSYVEGCVNMRCGLDTPPKAEPPKEGVHNCTFKTCHNHSITINSEPTDGAPTTDPLILCTEKLDAANERIAELELNVEELEYAKRFGEIKLAKARNDALEEAAEIAKTLPNAPMPTTFKEKYTETAVWGAGADNHAAKIGIAIRALKSEGEA